MKTQSKQFLEMLAGKYPSPVIYDDPELNASNRADWIAERSPDVEVFH